MVIYNCLRRQNAQIPDNSHAFPLRTLTPRHGLEGWFIAREGCALANAFTVLAPFLRCETEPTENGVLETIFEWKTATENTQGTDKP